MTSSTTTSTTTTSCKNNVSSETFIYLCSVSNPRPCDRLCASLLLFSTRAQEAEAGFWIPLGWHLLHSIF